MKLFQFLTLISCTWVLSPLKIQAQSTYALIVGISQYKEMPALQYADRDALAFAECLKIQQVPEQNIKLFLNEEAIRINIVDELFSLSQIMKPKDRFFFYFGGHGDLEAKISHENSLLLLYNSLKTSYFQGNEFLQLSELRTWFDALAKKQVEIVFIADACHSGGLIGGKEGVSKTQKALQESWGRVTKILSCQANEYALEGKQWGGGRGLFSYHLVNGLTGRADVNKDKKISLLELKNYLQTNVLREANPNLQTPVILGGNEEQWLSQVSKEGLTQLDEYEKRNFPIITEVNIKSKDDKIIADLEAMLDTSIVDTYRKFNKALKGRRLAPHDDSLDCALIHYKKLVAQKIPENLLQLMKRNLGATLMERELAIMKEVREKGKSNILKYERNLPFAIKNLEEIKRIFGPDHYLAPIFTARLAVLESQLPPKSAPVFPNNQSVDKNLQDQKEFSQKYRSGQKQKLLQGLALEPNMISTYALLGRSFGISNQPDSALYYLEKVTELLPNQGFAHYNLALGYEKKGLKSPDGKTLPHPKAIEHFEKAVLLDTTLAYAYNNLGSLYMGLMRDSTGQMKMLPDKNQCNYPRAIHCFEKLVAPYERIEKQLAQQGTNRLPQNYDGSNPAMNNFYSLIDYWNTLYLLHRTNGDTVKAAEYLKRMIEKAENGESASGFLLIMDGMYVLFEWSDDWIYLNIALEMQLKALKLKAQEIETALPEEKALASLKYREQLKGLGVTCCALKKYDDAEKYLLQAIAYPIPTSPITQNLKLMGGGSLLQKGKYMVTVPNSDGLRKNRNGEYVYQVDAFFEMFNLKWKQGKTEEAYEWLEKAFQVSLAENGNDISGQPCEDLVFDFYVNLDKARYKALRAKYAPKSDQK